MYDSIKYKIVKTGTGVDVQFMMSYYGQFIDKGVSGVKVKRGFTNFQGKTLSSPYTRKKQPPTAPLEQWIKARGLKGRVNKEWKSAGNRGGQFITNKSFAFLIARSIKMKGTKALMFFQKPLGVKLKTFGTDLQVAINKDVQDALSTLKFNK